MLNAKYLFSIGLLIAVGCAPAYHCYEYGCTPYDYCKRPPLPFVSNDSYCPTPAAGSYLWTSERAPQLDSGEMSIEGAEAPLPISQ